MTLCESTSNRGQDDEVLRRSFNEDYSGRQKCHGSFCDCSDYRVGVCVAEMCTCWIKNC